MRPLIVSEPLAGWRFPDVRELWAYRYLLYLIARRDVTVRYRQTVIGVLWVVLQPLSLALIFSLFLGALIQVPSEGAPYPVFAFAGMTLWLMFASALARCADCAVAGGPVISKLYFPRIILPLASVSTSLVDFAVAFVVLLGALLAYGVTVDPGVVLAPVFACLGLLLSLGLGLWLSATAVRYRDVQQLIPFLIQVLLFATPVLYPLSLVPDSVRPLYELNPLVGVFEGFRWAVLPGTHRPSALLLAVPVVAATALITGGLLFFQRAQTRFADDL